jgi:hypothetical protein
VLSMSGRCNPPWRSSAISPGSCRLDPRPSSEPLWLQISEASVWAGEVRRVEGTIELRVSALP